MANLFRVLSICLFFSFCFQSNLLSQVETTQEVEISKDNNNNNKANAGDSLKYKITIKNLGTMPLINSQFEFLSIDPLTQFDMSSIRMSNLARADAFMTFTNMDLVGGNLFDDNGSKVDILGIPSSVLTSFGGGSLGGTVESNLAGAMVTLAGGTLQVNADGTFSLTGQPFTAGTFTFLYRITNIMGTNDALVTIETVNPNDCPIAVDDSFSTDEDTPLNAGNVLSANPMTADSDPDNQPNTPLVVSKVNGLAASVGIQITLSSGALLTQNADGTFSYNPNGQFESLGMGDMGMDSYTYTISDGDCENMATVTINISGVNDAPTAINDAVSTDEDTELNGDVLAANITTPDSDPDGDILTVSNVQGAGANVGNPIVLGSGILTVNAVGTFSFDPNGGYEALAAGATATESFTYEISDGNGGMDDATVTITINGVNDAPTAVADNYNATQTAILNIPAPGILMNDTDPDSPDTKKVVAVNGVTTNVGTEITLTSGAKLTVNMDGSFDYNPGCTVSGSDSFMYTMEDGAMEESTATVTLTVAQSIWFVNNTNTSGTEDGSFGDPFNLLSEAQTASSMGHTIFVYEGDGTSTGYNAGIILKVDQQLIGEGYALTCPIDASTIVAAGNRPLIENAASNGIILASNNTIRGLNIGNATSGAIVGSFFGTLTASEIGIQGSGRALKLSTGTLDATFDHIISTSSVVEGIFLSNISGTLSVSGNTTINGSSSEAIEIGGATGSFDFGITRIGQTTAAAQGIDITGSGTATFTFDALDITNSAGRGLRASTAGTINIGGTANTINATGGAALEVSSTSTGVSGWIFNTMASTAAGIGLNGIFLNSVTGGNLTVNGTTTINGPATTGIRVLNGGTLTYDFGTTSIGQTTATNAGIDIASGNGSATFTFDDLDIVNSAGTGILANNSGTVNLMGSPTINSTGGPSVNITSTTGMDGGTPGFFFDSLVSTSSPTQGINLSSLPSDFTVSGNTTVTNATSEGIKVDGGTNVTLGASGGTGTLSVTSTMASGVAGDGTVDPAAVNINNLTGTFAINSDGGDISFNYNNDHPGIFVRNTVNVSIKGKFNPFMSQPANPCGSGSNCLEIQNISMGTGSANANGIDIDGASTIVIEGIDIHDIAIPNSNDKPFSLTNIGTSVKVSNNDIRNVDEGEGIDIRSTAALNDLTAVITGNRITGSGTSFMGAVDVGIQLIFGNTTSLTGKRVIANIADNYMSGINRGIGVLLSGDTGTTGSDANEITIKNNKIDHLNNDGIDFSVEKSSVSKWLISGNVLDGDSGLFVGADPDRGIDLVPGVFSGTAHVTISNNTVLDFLDEGIRIRSIVDPEMGTILANIFNNKVQSSVATDEAISLEAREGHTLHATVTNNELDHTSSEDAIDVTVTDAVLPSDGGTILLNATMNKAIGGGMPVGKFDLNQSIGTLSISQANSGDLSTDNNGVMVDPSGTIGLNAMATLPMLPGTAPTLLISSVPQIGLTK